ncbi:MAG: hypothetical protein ACYDA0_09605 [Candidatus Dormibacteraceae bacterium]
MTPIGWIGVWLLVASVVAIVVEGAVAVVWGVSMAKRSRALAERLVNDRAVIESDIARLRAAIVETRRLWRPYRRILRWVRHPLVIALLESYSRRRTRT